MLHPWGAAKICAQLQLDDETIAAALLHDVVEDTDVDLEDVRTEFGDEIAKLVEGVTKLTRVQFQSREQAEAENYRKLIIAMAEDVRVILIKLADRLHNLREIEYLGKQKQVQKAKETLEVYAPLAHRLGIHALKWELEDLAFETLHPRKYEEIKAMVTERRADREGHVAEAARILQLELDKVDIPAEISGRAKHFYSIYDKMAKKGREFNEIYDLTAMRVIVERSGDEGTRDCYGALGLIHSLWKPMPGPLQGLHRDAEVQPLPVAAHDGDRARGPAARDPGAHARDARDGGVRDRRALALQGRAAREDATRPGRRGCAQLMEAQPETIDEPREFKRAFLQRPRRRRGVRLHAEGRGEDAADGRDADRLRLRGAHGRRPPHRRREDQRPHRAAALPPEERRLRRDPDLEGGPRAVARLAVARGVLARAKQDPPVVLARDARGPGAEGPRGARAGAEGGEAARTASSPARPCSRR